MVPPPTRKIGVRLTTTYAGFTGESALLEELYSRGMRQPEIGPDLRAGDGMLFFWSHTPIAPWQTEAWLAAMRRSLRPNAYLRLVENRRVELHRSAVVGCLRRFRCQACARRSPDVGLGRRRRERQARLNGDRRRHLGR